MCMQNVRKEHGTTWLKQSESPKTKKKKKRKKIIMWNNNKTRSPSRQLASRPVVYKEKFSPKEREWGELHNLRLLLLYTAGSNLTFQTQWEVFGSHTPGDFQNRHREKIGRSGSFTHWLDLGEGWGYQAINYIVIYKVLFQSIWKYADSFRCRNNH